MIGHPKHAKKLPANSLTPHWVEDLIYFEGPLLSYVKGSSQQDYFYYWVDSDSAQNRWLAIPVDREQIRNYKNREISLRGIIDVIDELYFVDIDSELAVTRAFSIQRDQLNSEILPSNNSFFDPEFSPTGNDVLMDSTVYELKLSGNWFFEDFVFVPRRYIQIYSFIYSFLNFSKPSVRENLDFLFDKYPWQGGASRVNFFKDLRNAIPSMHEPKIKSMYMNSPGNIKLELLSSAADSVNQISGVCLQNFCEIETSVKGLNKFLSANGLKNTESENFTISPENKEELLNRANELCCLLGLSDFQSQIYSVSNLNPILYSKVLLSFDTRVRDLLKYVEKGMLHL